MRQIRFMICRVCGQRPASGRDPATGKKWKQCACDPMPASIKRTKAGMVAVPADPTEEDLEEIYGTRPVDDSAQEVDREIAERLAGLTREDYPYPIVGIECNGRVIPYTFDWFLPVPLSHTPHCMSRSRSENSKCGRSAEQATTAGVRQAKKNISGS